jgi:HSP20 family molecular chaperone IbpA
MSGFGPRDIDDLFNMIDKALENNFSGGYLKRNNNEEADDIFDMYEDKKHIYITLELRGVTEDDYNIKLVKDSLLIEILYNGKWQTETIKLPCKVKKRFKVCFNNYVLDIVLTKDKRKINGKIKEVRKYGKK